MSLEINCPDFFRSLICSFTHTEFIYYIDRIGQKVNIIRVRNYAGNGLGKVHISEKTPLEWYLSVFVCVIFLYAHLHLDIMYLVLTAAYLCAVGGGNVFVCVYVFFF